jgi:two-component system chemotaxis sensor kinase CheA
VKLTASLGKYRDLVVAIALFLVLDVGVLVFNVLTSREIEHDAAEINSAGALRMLSQQLAKSLLTLNFEVNQGLPIQTSLAQVFESSDEFEQSLAVLQKSNRSTFNSLIADGAAWDERRRLLTALTTEWTPLARDVAALLEKKDTLTAADVAPVTNKSVSRNLKLLQESDDLTQQMEDMARAKALQMREIQLAAILLAMLNFAFIVFKFVRQLNASDTRAELAREETRQILETVHEGLFLLHRDGTIGTQRSASIERLFSAAISDQTHFLKDVLKPALADTDKFDTARGYIDMLFDKKVKPSLLTKLNPLVEIEVTVAADARRGARQRFLSFAFDQVKRDGEVESLLVSVFDVTQKVLLERELAGAEERARNEVEVLLGVIDQDAGLVTAFIDGARQRIDEVNRELQGARPDGSSYGQVINLVARNVHWIKGEAALLNIGNIESYAHEFEDVLANLRGRRNLGGDDLIPVAVGVSELLDRCNRIGEILRRLARFTAATPQEMGTAGVADPLSPVIEAIEELTAKAARDLNKQVQLEVDVPKAYVVPDNLVQVCREVLPQLIRNAIVHGIEHSGERTGSGKDPVGRISVRIDLEGASGFRVRVRDDGRGVSLPAVRRRAVEQGWHSVEEARNLPDHRLVSLMFQPGFSTEETANLHGGRGDGLAVVREVLTTLGARLRILSSPKAFTEFVVYLPA